MPPAECRKKRRSRTATKAYDFASGTIESLPLWDCGGFAGGGSRHAHRQPASFAHRGCAFSVPDRGRRLGLPDKRTFLVPNIGFLESSGSVLVIDAGLTPDSGRGVLEAARALAGKRDLILTVPVVHLAYARGGSQAFVELHISNLNNSSLKAFVCHRGRTFEPVVPIQTRLPLGFPNYLTYPSFFVAGPTGLSSEE